MVDTVNDPADPEELAEEEGGSGMPMTATETVADDGDDIEDADVEDADPEDGDDTDSEDDEVDEEAADEASA